MRLTENQKSVALACVAHSISGATLFRIGQRWAILGGWIDDFGEPGKGNMSWAGRLIVEVDDDALQLTWTHEVHARTRRAVVEQLRAG